jgi:hypothetical protein
MPPLLLAAVLLVAAACGGGRGGTDDPLASAVEATPSPSEVLEPPDRESLPIRPETDKPVVKDVSQTDTEWGRIWDAVPAGFPVFPGAVVSDEAGGGEPVSATWTAGGTDAAEIATWLQSELELATYSTEALSGPLEDGSFVLDSVGDAGCRLETKIVPAGDLAIITVRFGADCPFE